MNEETQRQDELEIRTGLKAGDDGIGSLGGGGATGGMMGGGGATGGDAAGTGSAGSGH